MTWREEHITKLLETFRSQNLEVLDKEIEKYPSIKKLLSTPLKDMKNIPEYQKYLNLILPSERDAFANYTLHDLMDYSTINLPLNTHARYETLYSYNKEFPVGWFCYHCVGKEVDAIKMFSFGMNDLTFMRDVKEKFNEICKNYERIRWLAIRENPFIKHYIQAIVNYKGTCEEAGEDAIMFLIDKKQPNNNFSNLSNIFDEETLRKVKFS